MTEFYYYQHVETGDIYYVVEEYGQTIGVAGPLATEDVTADNLEGFTFLQGENAGDLGRWQEWEAAGLVRELEPPYPGDPPEEEDF